MLSNLLDRIADYVLGYLNPVNEVSNILGSFTRMVTRLDGAISKIGGEISSSYNREDQAWKAFRQVEQTEKALREDLVGAANRAANARSKIAEIVGA